jgi:hypothetical protein
MQSKEFEMTKLFSVVTVLSLFGAVAFVPVVGGILFSMVLFVLFLGGLVGALAEVGDRTVRPHNPVLDPKGWRNG